MSDRSTPTSADDEREENKTGQSQVPRRRKQSATGAVDRLTGIMGREKPQGAAEEDSTDQLEQQGSGKDEEKSPVGAEGRVTEEETDLSAGQSANNAAEILGSSTEPNDRLTGAASTKHGSPSQRAPTAQKESRIRASVDLSRRQHKFLKMFAVENESDGMSVLRELVGMLEEDEDIAPRLVERLQSYK